MNSPAEIKEIASKMLGHRLITKQTGPEGKLVDKVRKINTFSYNLHLFAIKGFDFKKIFH